MPTINNTLASQGNGVYQHKSLRFYCVLGAKMCQKRVPKLAKIKMRNTSPKTKVTIKNAKLRT